jgi:hypothetical protein
MLVCGMFLACNSTDPTPAPVDPNLETRDCVADPVVFTEYLIDPSLVKTLGEIGGIAAKTEIGGRSYIFPKDGQDGQRLPLKMPTDMKILAARRYIPPGAPTPYTPDWSLSLDAGCGIKLGLAHVKDLSDTIKNLVDTTIYSSSGWVLLDTPIVLKAGVTFGWYIPGPSAVAFDFIADDASVTNQFVNRPRYVARNSNILTVVCPYDLFEPTKKAAYYALLGTGTGNLAPGAGCGTAERDLIGTPAGQWFFDSTFVVGQPSLLKDGYYGEPLPLIIAADSMVQVGHIGPNDDFRIPRTNPSWKDLRTITTEWCYQALTLPPSSAPDGWLWLKMVTPTKMNVAYAPTGSCPSTFPAGGFKTYFR